MPQTRTTRVALVVLCCLVSIVAAGCPDDVDGACPTCVVDDPAPPPPVDAGCAEAVAWFEQEAWPRVFSTCAGCHVTGGQADGTRFQLQPATIPDFARININVLKAVSALEVADGRLLLLKPTQRVAHGGGEVVVVGSDDELVLQETIDLVQDVLCPITPKPPEGLTLLSPLATLHKASVQLVGRAPTDEEVALVEGDGDDGLVDAVQAMMREAAFDERVREFYGDVFLTDGFRANNAVGNSGSIVNGDNFSGADDHVAYFGGEDYDWRSWPNGEGIEVVEALAREPLEFFVKAVREDRPLTDVVTARHRLLNAYSARFFNVDYKGNAPGTAFADIDDPEEFVVVEHVDGVNEIGGVGEYAGVLTTSAWLNRYPSSPTNFNRKRARFTLKYFLDFDIMKAAPRIDAATVDLNANPTKNNLQCTACHVRIDPLAGLYMNQGGCGYSVGNYYRLPEQNNDCTDDGWRDAEVMFAPGTSVDAADVLPREERRRALEHLGDFIAAQPEFARAMVTPIFVSLMGRARLVGPANPTTSEEVALASAAVAEDQEIARLAQVFVDGGMKLPPVVAAIVTSPFFRGADVDLSDGQRGGRFDLAVYGGGALVTPERLDRKLKNILGVTWAGHGGAVSSDTGFQRLGRHDGTDDSYLLLREELKTLFGGVDGSFSGVKARQKQPSTLTAAIAEHMALEVSCIAVSRDFARAPGSRFLFRGDASDVRATVIDLHWLILGDDAPDDADIDDAVALFDGARADGLAAIAAGDETTTLQRPCAATVDLATGQSVEGDDDDADYVVRAWQAVIASLLLDPRFVLER